MALFHKAQGFRSVFDTTRLPLALASARDDDQPLVTVNPQFEALTGYSAAESIGRNCRFLARKQPGGDQHAKLRTVIERNGSGSATIANFRKSGDMFLNFVTIFPLYGLSGVIEYFLGSQVDVTRPAELSQRALDLGPDAPVSAHLVQHAFESSLLSASVQTKSLQLLLQMKINEELERIAVRGAGRIMKLPQAAPKSGHASSGYDAESPKPEPRAKRKPPKKT